MSRSAYRSVANGDRTNEMATAKESGAIEYSARIAASLKGVQGEPGLVEMRIFKNKHGRSHAHEERGIHLRMDRANQTLTEDSAFEPAMSESAEVIKTARRDVETTADAARVALIIAQNPGVPAKRCEELVSGATPGRLGRTRYAAARGRLGRGLVEVPGKGTTKHMHLDGTKVPITVLMSMPADDQALIRASRPPADHVEVGDLPRGAPTRPQAPQGGSHTTEERDAPTPPMGGGGASPGVCHEAISAASGASGAGRHPATREATFDDGLPEKPRRRRKAKAGCA